MPGRNAQLSINNPDKHGSHINSVRTITTSFPACFPFVNNANPSHMLAGRGTFSSDRCHLVGVLLRVCDRVLAMSCVWPITQHLANPFIRCESLTTYSQSSPPALCREASPTQAPSRERKDPMQKSNHLTYIPLRHKLSGIPSNLDGPRISGNFVFSYPLSPTIPAPLRIVSPSTTSRPPMTFGTYRTSTVY